MLTCSTSIIELRLIQKDRVGLIVQKQALRIVFETSWSSMKEMTHIGPWHFGQVSGSASYIFRMSLAQFLRYALDDSSDCKTQGTNPSWSAFFRFPRETLL